MSEPWTQLDTRLHDEWPVVLAIKQMLKQWDENLGEPWSSYANDLQNICVGPVMTTLYFSNNYCLHFPNPTSVEAFDGGKEIEFHVSVSDFTVPEK